MKKTTATFTAAELDKMAGPSGGIDLDELRDATRERDDERDLRSRIQALGGYEGDAGINYYFDRPDGVHRYRIVLSRLTVVGDSTLPTSIEDDCLLTVWNDDGSEPFASMEGQCMNLLVVIRLMLGST